MYFVYILKSQKYDDKTYIGVTSDVERRLNEHNSGASTYTKTYLPWRLISTIGFVSKEKAEEFEKYLKRGSGFAFMKKHLLP